MFAIEKINALLHKKPLVLIRFDPTTGEAFSSAVGRKDKFTFTVPHDAVRKIASPTLCIIEVEEFPFTLTRHCYLGAFTRKAAASNVSTHVTIRGAVRIKPDLIEDISQKLPPKLLKIWTEKLQGSMVEPLSEKLGLEVFQCIAKDQDNSGALAAIHRFFEDKRRVPASVHMQRDAIIRG